MTIMIKTVERFRGDPRFLYGVPEQQFGHKDDQVCAGAHFRDKGFRTLFIGFVGHIGQSCWFALQRAHPHKGWSCPFHLAALQ